MIAETAMYLSLMLSQNKYLAETAKLIERLDKDGYKEIVELVKDPQFRLFDPNPLRKKYNKIDLTNPKEHRYMRNESTQDSINFMEKRKEWLDEAEKLFPGIKREYITAVLNVESLFGKNKGDCPILNAVMSNYVFTERKDLFYEYTTEFLKFVREKGITDVFALKGSFTGASTPAQLMPTSLRKYSYDLDGDGFEPDGIEDAIGSCANMLWKKGGRKDIMKALRAYNGEKYARAVDMHAQKVRQKLASPLARKPPVVRKIPQKV
ncbi:MAG: lytic murein transglycosylase [Candidatus Aenigmarchaeota archaeon]|nr:lytic murein transglycosylase [Candidatus Aenigmarchaeota archaeon]